MKITNLFLSFNKLAVTGKFYALTSKFSKPKTVLKWAQMVFDKKIRETLISQHFSLKILMPATGIEPVPYCYDRILSPARLPVPPRRHISPARQRYG